jgi:hypothetical protein
MASRRRKTDAPNDAASAAAARAIQAIRAARGIRPPAPPPTFPRREHASIGETAAREIERMQRLRGRPDRAVAVADLVRTMQRTGDRSRRRLGSIIELWSELVPPHLAAHTTIAGLRGGILHVRAESAPAAFEIDRRLREGLLAELRRRYDGTLARVRVTADGAPAPPPEGRSRHRRGGDR